MTTDASAAEESDTGKADEYHQYAAECRAFAARAVDDFNRMSLLQVAEAWDELADQRGDVPHHPMNRISE